MSKNSGIEWTDLRRVFAVVALVAQSQAVAHIEAKSGMVSKGLDVVRSQIPAATVPAPLTGEAIAHENVVPPPFVFGCEPLAATFREAAILERVAGGAARSSLPRDRADALSRFQSVTRTGSAIRSAALGGTDPKPLFRRHLGAF